MLIALIYDEYSAGLVQSLSPLGKVEVFGNQFQLRDYLLRDEPCDLVVSATDGALGMNVCLIAREQRKVVPILWLTEQKEFEPQSKRTPVNVFLVKPIVLSEVFEAAKLLLENPPKEIPPAEPTWENPKPQSSHTNPPPLPPPKKTLSQWFWSLF